MSKLYSINNDVLLNELDNQGVVFCQDDSGEKIYYLNDTSLAIVSFIKNKQCTFEEIVNEVVRLFEIGAQDCVNDVNEFIDSLIKFHIIVES